MPRLSSHSPEHMARIFIDGQAGTTGLEIATRLSSRDDVELLTLLDAERKDANRRAELLSAADISILCLPDDAAREAVRLVGDEGRLIDASTAHRVAPDWVYGLPELGRAQREAIKTAHRVANPGCYPQGFILLIRPLIEQGWISVDAALRCDAVSGYSGGGRQMIEARRAMDEPTREANNTQLYGLHLQHKHVPEMQHYSGLKRAPIFSPSVAHYHQGMLVKIALFAEEVSNKTPIELLELYRDTYANEVFIETSLAESFSDDGFLNPTAMNHSNKVQLMVGGHAEQIQLIARYDNLGKGAAGAAIQNMNLMLGLAETVTL